MQMDTHAYVHTHVHTYSYIHTYIYMDTHIHIFVYRHAHTHIYTNMHTRTQIQLKKAHGHRTEDKRKQPSWISVRKPRTEHHLCLCYNRWIDLI